MRNLNLFTIGLLIGMVVILCCCIQTPHKPTSNITTMPTLSVTTSTHHETEQEQVLSTLLKKYGNVTHYTSIIEIKAPSVSQICSVAFNNDSYKAICSSGHVIYANRSGMLILDANSTIFQRTYYPPPLIDLIENLKTCYNNVVIVNNTTIAFNCHGNHYEVYIDENGNISKIYKNHLVITIKSLNLSAKPIISFPPEFIEHINLQTTNNTKIYTLPTNNTTIIFYYHPLCPHCHTVLPLVKNWTKLKNVSVHICNVTNMTDPVCYKFKDKVWGVPVAIVVDREGVKTYLGASEITNLDKILRAKYS